MSLKERREFYVVLDSRTTAGQLYMQNNADGTINLEGQPAHPFLICQNIEFAAYLYVERALEDGHVQRLHIPHQSVVMVHVMGEDDPKPFGFTPN